MWEECEIVRNMWPEKNVTDAAKMRADGRDGCKHIRDDQRDGCSTLRDTVEPC